MSVSHVFEIHCLLPHMLHACNYDDPLSKILYYMGVSNTSQHSTSWTFFSVSVAVLAFL